MLTVGLWFIYMGLLFDLKTLSWLGLWFAFLGWLSV